MSEITNKQTGAAKTARNPIKIVPLQERLRKPEWIRVKTASGTGYNDVKKLLREHSLVTVCEEASCKPLPPDVEEPANLARSIGLLKLKYVVITSVDRDDLRDGGAAHFSDCLAAIRVSSPETRLEILIPDFRGRLDEALDALAISLPDVLNHNLEPVPRLYKLARPGADYAHSLKLLQDFKTRFPDIPTKSGVMLGLGETDEEVLEVMKDLRAHGVNMLTVGQYLQPSNGHLPVLRYAPLESFAMFEREAKAMGFDHAACSPMVRSSYYADEQAHQAGVCVNTR